MSLLRSSSGIKTFLRITALASTCSLFAPLESQACGGFFCNSSNPVNQSAERILFARRDGQIDMHIQIQYQGPSTDFGWILPTAPGVETELSSEALFAALDRLYAPTFQLRYQYGDNCQVNFADFASGSNFDEVTSDPEVQVISREAIGPYDRAILSAESVEALRTWLDTNQFQIPESLDAAFQPYIDAGAVFVVIKLLPDRDEGDIVPLRLTFPGDRPSIPLLPTAVAATPDMGIIAHILDTARAVPVNYRHVLINEAAIDWLNSGSNYPDVVSQAIDEAGGRAFTTDFAGEHGGALLDPLTPFSEAVLSEIASAQTVGELTSAIPDRTNPDFQRVAASLVAIPEDVDPDDFFRCASCYYGDMFSVDGAAVANLLRTEVNPAYENITELLNSLPYLTRLYSTMSPQEMDRDPIFSINPDMEAVSNLHFADVSVTCNEEGNPETNEITLEDGRRYIAEEATPIVRQAGETVRGDNIAAAAVVEQTMEAGQPERIMEANIDIMNPENTETMGGSETGGAETGGSEMNSNEAGSETSAGADGSTSAGKDEESGCQQTKHTALPFFALVFSLFPLLRRREQRA